MNLPDSFPYLTITEVGQQLRSGQLSPVTLVEAYLSRSAELGPRFNAYATLSRDRALKQARAAELEIKSGHYRGPLHGIPYAAKDLVAVKGYPTTWGARPFADQSFDYDATVIRRLDDAGAILIGKSAMIELAGGLGYEHGSESLTGPARNPWNPDYWTCGSSSGSGAVVAAGLACFALGSDTRGSIICPSSWCGIAGMRPSFGRVSRYGSMAIAWTMDKLGPMARTAEDCGLVLSVIAGHDPKDHDSLPEPQASFHASPAPKPLRIGRLTNVWNKLDPAQDQSVDAALKVLEQHGAQVHDVEVPDGPYEEVAELTILIEAASAFENLIHSGNCAKLSSRLGQINGYVSEEISAGDYLHIQRVRTFLQQKIDRLFDDIDVLVSAGESGPAEPLSVPPDEDSGDQPIERRAPDGISSLCGLPAITVPCGFSSKRLPLSVQFIGRALHDHNVIAAAKLYQSYTNWHLQHPPGL